MLYIDFEAGSKAYKLRLNTRNTVQLEKQLGCNPISIFGAGDTIPTITQMVSILHAALQPYHANIGLNDAYEIFDNWIEDGHATTDFIPVIIDIYRASGIIKEEKTNKETEEKN